MTDTINYRPMRYWEKSIELIDRLKLAREVKSTALDGKLFQNINNTLKIFYVPKHFHTIWCRARPPGPS